MLFLRKRKGEFRYGDTYTYRRTKRDKHDKLAIYKDEFYIPTGTIYMDGNSLGLLSKRAERTLLELLESWKTLGIDGWTEGEHPWFYLSEQVGRKWHRSLGE